MRGDDEHPRFSSSSQPAAMVLAGRPVAFDREEPLATAKPARRACAAPALAATALSRNPTLPSVDDAAWKRKNRVRVVVPVGCE